MKKPNLSIIWEMVIIIPEMRNYKEQLIVFREKVISTIDLLENGLRVEWYSFLIHNRNNGVSIDYEGPLFHIRFENTKNIEKEKLISILPEYCEMIQKADIPNSISGINLTLLENEKIDEVWKILGEFCQWFLNSIKNHKNDNLIKTNLCAFFHYHTNILQPIIEIEPNYRINLADQYPFVC